ncbi:CrcB family protein, partial [Campylobacter jejuni]
MLNTLLVVGFGGFIGAILRMFSINLVNKFFPYSISLGTLFVNVLGSFIIGLLFSYAQ